MWIAGLATAVAHAMLRSHRLPLWALTVIGAVVASVILIPMTHELNAWVRTHWAGGHLLREMSWPVTSDRLRELIMSSGRAIVLWTAFTYVFAATLGWSRYQYAPRDAKPVSAGRDRFANSGRSWTEDADRQLAAYVAAGLSPVEIAQRMQRTVAAVRIRIAKIKSETARP